MIDPRRLAILLNVHRSGGVLAAADNMYLSPSAVSQQISRLEAEAGVTVLDRQPGGAVLTAAGRVLAEAAERIETELTDARRALAMLREDITGTVVIGAFQTVIRSLLVPLVADIEQRLPGLDVLIREVDGERGHRELSSGAIDLLVLEADSPVGQRSPRYMRDVALLDEPWLVAIPSSVPTPTTVSDLENETWLGVDPSAAAHGATERVLANFPHPPRVAHRYDDYDVAISMVSGGLGVALLPSFALQGVLPEGVEAAAVPGVGTRRLIARHRVTRTEPRQAVMTVLEEAIQAGAALDLSTAGAPTPPEPAG